MVQNIPQNYLRGILLGMMGVWVFFFLVQRTNMSNIISKFHQGGNLVQIDCKSNRFHLVGDIELKVLC